MIGELGLLQERNGKTTISLKSWKMSNLTNGMDSPNHTMEKVYDIVVSFAGEDRTTVEDYVQQLKLRSVTVFYDKYEQAELWGVDLYSRLDDIYQNKARYCVIFISCHYAEKLWTNHERQSAQARAFRENETYLLPVRLDDTKIPGIRDTTGYIDLRTSSIKSLVDLTIKKLSSTSEAHEKVIIEYKETKSDPILALVRKTEANIHRKKMQVEYLRSRDAVRDAKNEMDEIRTKLVQVAGASNSLTVISANEPVVGISCGNIDLIFCYYDRWVDQKPPGMSAEVHRMGGKYSRKSLQTIWRRDFDYNILDDGSKVWLIDQTNESYSLDMLIEFGIRQLMDIVSKNG
jgi:hypothetical protein